jgi:hypothetical protein
MDKISTIVFTKYLRDYNNRYCIIWFRSMASGIDRKIILKWILRKQSRSVWIGFTHVHPCLIQVSFPRKQPAPRYHIVFIYSICELLKSTSLVSDAICSLDSLLNHTVSQCYL